MPTTSNTYTGYSSLLINILLITFVVLNLIVSAVMIWELIEVALINTTEYPFGWEGGGTVYQSKNHYIFFCIIDILISGFVVVAFFLKRRKVLIASIALSLVYHALYFFFLNPVFK